MPSALVSSLVAPIREVQALVGPGWSGEDDAAVVLAGVRDALAEVSEAARRTWGQAADRWTGAGADGAAEFAFAAAEAAEQIALRTDQLRASAGNAADAVARASARLRAIVEEFETRAAALEQHLDEPGVAEELRAEARRALTDAVGVVDGLRTELDAQAGSLPSSPATAPPVPTNPFGYASTPAMGSGLGGAAPINAPSGLGGMFGSSPAEPATFSPHGAAEPLADPGTFGGGVAIQLPDGSTAVAPNTLAANAVRHALTQLGVPYVWGGTTPGVGLDCSGLTQWAYHEAGLNLPRLAQEQDVGAAVDPGALRPGDLAVWDGHVAMIVGNGTMIEAGDPVQLSPIRTTNAGQGFQGFFRPTG